MKRPARGGGRWVEVAPPRLTAWLESFAARHQGAAVTATAPEVVTFAAGDGAIAECHVPFPPLPGVPGAADAAAEVIVAHVQAPRTVGVLLVRLGGYAVGVFAGSPPQLAASKVGSPLVHGRSAAGGRSQHRFARRREKQAAEALSAAADTAVAVLGPFGGQLDAVVLGGDRRAVSALRDDPRLKRFFELANDRFLTVPDPRLAVLRDAPRMFSAIRIRLAEPGRGVTAGPAPPPAPAPGASRAGRLGDRPPGPSGTARLVTGRARLVAGRGRPGR